MSDPDFLIECGYYPRNTRERVIWLMLDIIFVYAPALAGAYFLHRVIE